MYSTNFVVYKLLTSCTSYPRRIMMPKYIRSFSYLTSQSVHIHLKRWPAVSTYPAHVCFTYAYFIPATGPNNLSNSSTQINSQVIIKLDQTNAERKWAKYRNFIIKLKDIIARTCIGFHRYECLIVSASALTLLPVVDWATLRCNQPGLLYRNICAAHLYMC
jgi:hypothetical protein